MILHLHRQIYRYSGGRGGSLKQDPNQIVSRRDGIKVVVFEPPPPEETEFMLSELVDRYNQAQAERSAHPLILLSALIIDFLAIHPVADGNGRLARLITTHELLAQGYGVSRYVSIEQRIFETKAAYYSSLRESQTGWHDGSHQVWAFATYLLSILADAYDAFESRTAAQPQTGVSKQNQVRTHILQMHGGDSFSRMELEQALPEISTGTIKLVLSQLGNEGMIQSDGTGRSSRWHRTANQ